MPAKLPRRKQVVAQKPSARRRSELAQELLPQLQQNCWALAGQRIGVAVSGGADSVALLLLLLEMREKIGFVLSVVHFNHKLRGRASDGDEKFVASLATRHHLPFFVARENMARKSARERANLEDAARRARYAYFERLVAAGKLDRVAVAHTADDQAETVLAHILRGTGLAGLAGIHPEVGCVFRPLLQVRRGDLRHYLRAGKQSWREDATNRDTKRMRARIRLKLMPVMEKQFQPAVVEHLCQLANFAREDEAWLESSAALRVFLNAKEEKGEWSISLSDLLAAHPPANQPKELGEWWRRDAPQAMSKRLIRLLVKKVKPHSGQLSAVHVNAVLRLAEQADSGKSLPLPGGVEVRRLRDAVVFRAVPSAESNRREGPPMSFCYPVKLGAKAVEVALVEQSCRLRFTVIDWPPQGRETKVTGAVLDRERIRLPLVVRNWRPGDSMQALGHQKRHKLSRLLNELGVSRWDKVWWPVLTSGEAVAWTRGLPVSSELAPSGSTRKAVVITEVPIS